MLVLILIILEVLYEYDCTVVSVVSVVVLILIILEVLYESPFLLTNKNKLYGLNPYYTGSTL